VKGIRVWAFPRDSIPQDLQAKTPNPDSWGTPVMYLSSSKCDIATNFQGHSLILDITICGSVAELDLLLTIRCGLLTVHL
jgi:hypothetical protein